MKQNRLWGGVHDGGGGGDAGVGWLHPDVDNDVKDEQ